MIEELKTFISVVEFKNFTKAAKHLNLSQPSVSNHIKSLEKYFNTIIIDRSIKQKNIYITENGEILYKRAKEILNLLDMTMDELHNTTQNVEGHLKIGASLTIGEYILPNFLKKFCSKYPNIQIEVLIENTKSICDKLSNISFDIGLVEGTVSSPNLNQTYFYEDEMVLALPYNSDIKEDNFTLDKLKKYNWIGREKGSGTREYLDMFLNNSKIQPKNIMVFGSNYAVKEAVKNNLGVTIVSSLIAYPSYYNKELKIISLDYSFTRNFSYILANNITHSKANNLFIRELKDFVLTL
ncbi:LysR substrate-binding domain-containing protein [Terrisporobacter petrolearius]|uniref:LysR substrate-binding domain-containing protein n=1 Tax=Terrisporobacter petrolearius TaxID=1460447 RepID=UPI003B003C79